MHALILNYSKCINISVAADDETAPQGNAMHAVPLTLNMNADGFLLDGADPAEEKRRSRSQIAVALYTGQRNIRFPKKNLLTDYVTTMFQFS